MKANGVLVLGLNRHRELTDALFDVGLAPVVRETMEDVLKRLRHETFCAVVLDQTDGNVDALEFILNVRDMDADIPIVVVGEAVAQTPTDVLLSQENTKVLDVPFRVQELIDELSNMAATP